MRKEKMFVIRLWSDSESSCSWRASLEDLKTKQRQNFASLELLAEHLKNLEQSKTSYETV